jgi:SET domain-containing protein
MSSFEPQRAESIQLFGRPVAELYLCALTPGKKRPGRTDEAPLLFFKTAPFGAKSGAPDQRMTGIIIIKESSIHGLGIFAARDICAGEVIIDWKECTEKLTEREVEGLSIEDRKRVSVIGGEQTLFKPPACWVNHSCAPNARGEAGRDIAIRPIKKGEEITVDYVVEKVPDLKIWCNCGSPACRGLLG